MPILDINNNPFFHLKDNNKNSTSRKKKIYLVKKVLKNFKTFSLPGTKENGESPNKNLPKGKDNNNNNKDKRTINDIKIEKVKSPKEKEYLNEIEKNKKTINELNQFKFKMEKELK